MITHKLEFSTCQLLSFMKSCLFMVLVYLAFFLQQTFGCCRLYRQYKFQGVFPQLESLSLSRPYLVSYMMLHKISHNWCVRFAMLCAHVSSCHDDVIKWKHFPCYWLFVRRIHWSPMNSPQRPLTRSFDVYLFWAWINGWVNNREAGDLRRHSAHCDVTVMWFFCLYSLSVCISPGSFSCTKAFVWYLRCQ